MGRWKQNENHVSDKEKMKINFKARFFDERDTSIKSFKILNLTIIYAPTSVNIFPYFHDADEYRDCSYNELQRLGKVSFAFRDFKNMTMPFCLEEKGNNVFSIEHFPILLSPGPYNFERPFGRVKSQAYEFIFKSDLVKHLNKLVFILEKK